MATLTTKLVGKIEPVYNVGVKQFLFYLSALAFVLISSASCEQSQVNITQPDNEADALARQIETQIHNVSDLNPTINGTIVPVPPAVTIDPQMQSLFVTVTPTEMPAGEISNSDRLIICSPLAGETIDSLWEIISDPYHPPPPGRDERHHGVDFAYYRRGDRMSIEGVGIQAIMPGIVAAVLDNRLPYGNMIIVETSGEIFPYPINELLGLRPGESVYHLYAHMQSKPVLRVGEWVACGDELGQVGTTGYYIVEPHLHIETRIGPEGQVFDNMAFYDTRATQAEIDTYLRWRVGGEFQHFDPMRLFDLYRNQFILP